MMIGVRPAGLFCEPEEAAGAQPAGRRLAELDGGRRLKGPIYVYIYIYAPIYCVYIYIYIEGERDIIHIYIYVYTQ